MKPTNIIEYFGSWIHYKKNDFLTNLVFFITKGCVPLSLCNSPCFQHLVLQCDSKVDFPSRRSLVQEHIPLMLSKSMEEYVLPSLTTCVTISITFDLWMSKTSFDTFAMVINFVDNNWVSRHITIGLLKTPNTFGVFFSKIGKTFLVQFQFVDKVLICVKDEGNNLNTFENVFPTTTRYKLLELEKPFINTCSNHVMSKMCQYAITKEVCASMKEVSIKRAQVVL